MTPYTPPSLHLTAFNCPLCGAYAKQTRFPAAEYRNGPARHIQNYEVVHCGHCQMHSVWVSGKMVYPFTGTAPLPNPDMPDDVKQDYEEARNISMISPRGAAALLRLSIQKLCKHLGQSGENINADIAALVKNGLTVKLQHRNQNKLPTFMTLQFLTI